MDEKEYSGKFVLRVPPEMHRRLVAYGQALGLSLNCACLRLLGSALDPQQPGALPYGLGGILAPQSELSTDILGLVLYGSEARGEATSASDVDILVVVAAERPITRSLYSQVDATPGLDRRVSLMLSHLPGSAARPGSLWLEVSQDGIVLFDRDRSVTRMCAAIRRQIAAGRMSRRESHGQGYWVYAE
jgi:hypothetical protein